MVAFAGFATKLLKGNIVGRGSTPRKLTALQGLQMVGHCRLSQVGKRTQYERGAPCEVGAWRKLQKRNALTDLGILLVLTCVASWFFAFAYCGRTFSTLLHSASR